VIAAAAAAKLPLDVEQPGVWRPAVLQHLGVDVGPPSAGRTGGEDHMPGAQIIEPDRIARRNVLVLFHSARAMPEGGAEQERDAPTAARRWQAASMSGFYERVSISGVIRCGTCGDVLATVFDVLAPCA
jgi:hypothetical protein